MIVYTRLLNRPSKNTSRFWRRELLDGFMGFRKTCSQPEKLVSFGEISKSKDGKRIKFYFDCHRYLKAIRATYKTEWRWYYWGIDYCGRPYKVAHECQAVWELHNRLRTKKTSSRPRL